MLGLGRASQYASWWNQNGPLVVNITAPGAVSQSIYQTPAYSFEYESAALGTVGSADLYYLGNIDFTGYTSLPTYNDNRWTMASTFYMNWDPSTSSGGVDTTYNFLHQAKFIVNTGLYASGFWALNQFTQLRASNSLAITSRIETDYSIQRIVHELPGPWTDYNNRWLTLIYSCAETPSVYANYNSTSGTTTGNYYTRACLYDTETLELLDTADGRFNPTNGFSPFSSLPNTVPTDVSGSNGISVSLNGPVSTTPIRQNNLWGSFGTMFDPKTLPDTSIFTARPNNTIGNAKAWYNVCFTDYVDAGGDEYFVKATNQDLYSAPSDIGFRLTYSGGNTPFAGGYSTTIIPKDKS